MQEHGLARGTVRKAVDALVQEGLVNRVPGPRHFRSAIAKKSARRCQNGPTAGKVAGETTATRTMIMPNTLCVPKTCATWADAPQLAVGSVWRLASSGHVSGGPGVR
jgi:hypothetical protein